MTSEDYKIQAKETLKKILRRYNAVIHEPVDLDSDIDYFVNFMLWSAKLAVEEDREKDLI